MIDQNRYNIYKDKFGRYIAYDKETQKNRSYPRVIMEDYLGRELLATEHVHHRDGNPANNDISNLEVIDGRKHQRMHGLTANPNKKYFDKMETCRMCNRSFLWTGKQQCIFAENKVQTEKAGKVKYGPFCSRRCAGLFATLIQYHRI